MDGWRVWGELRRRPHIELAWALLTGHRGCIEDLGGGRRRITIEARLGRVDRRAVLAHELVHDERSILFSDTTPVLLVAKEEAYVIAETTRRLVPHAALVPMVQRIVDDDGCVEWTDVAEWFDVPRDVAERAMRSVVSSAGGPGTSLQQPTH